MRRYFSYSKSRYRQHTPMLGVTTGWKAMLLYPAQITPACHKAQILTPPKLDFHSQLSHVTECYSLLDSIFRPYSNTHLRTCRKTKWLSSSQSSHPTLNKSKSKPISPPIFPFFSFFSSQQPLSKPSSKHQNIKPKKQKTYHNVPSISKTIPLNLLKPPSSSPTSF